MIDKALLAQLVSRYPAQPATAFWRSIEIDVLSQALAPQGLGLDLGCGDGILTDILFQRRGVRPRLVGVDIDHLETAAASRYGFYERVHTCPGDAIPEADATFDYVISNSVLEHIPDLEAVIAEVGRVLKPGGQFAFTVPGPGFHANLYGSLFGGERDRYLASLDGRLAHYHYLSADEWSALCARHGLSLDRAEGYLWQAHTRRWETLSRMTGGLLHAVGRGRKRPIEIQRLLGLRTVQNAASLPRPIASALATLIATGVEDDDVASASSDAETLGGVPSCLLIAGHRACAS